jgi:acetoin utilization deacetylase AcuC-like enzyme
MQAGLFRGEALRVPHAATDEKILRAHDAGYLRRVTGGEFTPAEIRRHVFRDHGEGSCVFNDSAIAALAIQA